MAKHRYKKISDGVDTDRVNFVSLLLSLLLFRWMNIVFKTGNERALENTDFLPLSKENSSCLLTEQLQTKWNDEKTKCKGNGKKAKLWKSVLKMLSVKEFILFIALGGLCSVCRSFEPLLLGYFMVSLLSVESQHSYLLYGCALAMFINGFIRSLSAHQFAHRGEMFGIRISSALKGLVYHKVRLKVFSTRS